MTGKSIRFLGHLYEDGQVVCAPCARPLLVAPFHGWRWSLYEGDRVRAFSCLLCGGKIAG